MSSLVVYFSSSSRNTERFVEKLGVRSIKIPAEESLSVPKVSEPYVLIVPTYAGGDGKGAVHPRVVEFLKDEETRSFMKAVIASGARNFGIYYGYAGNVVSKNCGVPCIHKFELMGTPDDVDQVKKKLDQLWTQ